MCHVGVNLTKVHVWAVKKGPLGDCNRATAEPENLRLFAKLLREDALADATVLRDAAADIGFDGTDLRCLDENYLNGGFWPDHPDFAVEVRAAALDGIERSLETGRRLVTVITQLPDLSRPWVEVIDLFEEVVLGLFLPAAPLDPSS